ncbi:MAG TPA: T9SS type A sorting domain-containing protein [bacterium]|nr:T9SS type A sorting domain-containing protein [bacterium]
MKGKYSGIFGALLAGAVLLMAPRALTNELIVEWEDPVTGEVIVDALRDAIAADADRPDDRVYKLRKGGFYWITETLVNDGWHLRIVGEDPGPGELDNPAVLQMVARGDGSVNQRILTGGDDVTLKNLYIIGCDDSGVQTAYQPIQIDASNSRFVFDGIILERTNFALIAVTGSGNSIYYTNCVFRNLIGKPSTQQWEGRAISIWADQDTVVVENCTFFNIGMTALQIEGGAADYVRFNHNTLVNIGRTINTGNWWREAYFANNLVINGFWHGEGVGDYTADGRDPRAYTSGMFSVGPLPSKYGPEQGRRVLFANTAGWRDPAFAAFYAADAARAQPFINAVTKEDFVVPYENIVVRDTSWLPAMPDIGTYTPDIIPDMIQNITDLRAGNLPANPWFWELPEDAVVPGEICHVCPSWPLPEDFSYTTASLLNAGTDGLPLGDLNWFPDRKAEFEANKDQFVADLKTLAGPIKVYDVVDEAEAEEGALAGDAVIEEFEGFTFFQMDGGGFIQWVFDLPAEAQVDLNVWTHMRGNDMRGQRIIVNGISIHDPKGWGEYIWDSGEGIHAGMPTNEWTWTLITQANILEAGALTLPAGENTIRIEQSWGWQHFAGIDIIDFASREALVELRAPDATFDIVALVSEGAPWVPSGFKSVALNTDGNITWDLTAPDDGEYALQVFYQNVDGLVVGEIHTNGAFAVSVNFESNDDSTGLSVLSETFPLTAGTHAITLSGSRVKADVIKLVKVSVISSVKGRGDLPRGFALEQNYPNPFNPTTNIHFALGKASNVRLTVFNILGQKVATLIDAPMEAGSHQVLFDAGHLTSGIYFYRLEAGDIKIDRRMTLLK